MIYGLGFSVLGPTVTLIIAALAIAGVGIGASLTLKRPGSRSL